MFSYELDTPIYALATPYSPSALAIVRVSGKGSLSLFYPYFTGKLETSKSSSVTHGYVIDKMGEKIDEVMVIKYEKGSGYTREEALEIISHGSLEVIKRISLLLENIGFREALRGEFTYRAFLSGRMDLTEAEAVEELVKSKSEYSRKESLSRLTGSIRREAENAKGEILNILASLEVYLDYGEDELIESWVFPEERVNKIISRLSLIRDTYSSSSLYSNGAKVVICGKTNAGKSSLFNALLKENRAIVSDEEGTTRDYIKEDCLFLDIPVSLYDTAGLRETSNSIEKEGINKTNKLIEDADVIIHLLDEDEEEGDDEKTVYVHSKSDLKRVGELYCSSQTGEGIKNVVSEVVNKLKKNIEIKEGIPSIESKRQRDCIDNTIKALKRAIDDKDSSYDLLSLSFQEALSSLSLLSGEVVNDDILEEIFSSFCLGK